MIIFLDVDGVLNCIKTWDGPFKDGSDTLDPELCDNLALIVKTLNAKVVISSTWRLFPKTVGWWKLNEWMKERGVEIIGQTPDLSMENSFVKRGEEIKSWLINHHKENENFLIIDDDEDFLEDQKPFFIQTKFEDGLTKELAERAISLGTINNV